MLAASLLGAGPSAAWGPLGHRTVAFLAEERLSTSTAKAVHDLLGGISLPDVSACADEARERSFKCAGAIPMGKGEADWHFINLPIGGNHSAASLQGHCRRPRAAKGSCVVEQIRAQERLLADRKAPREARRLALVWLVHLVGDIHQPLHASTEYETKSRHDLGGGKKVVIVTGSMDAMNLHRLWDGLVRLGPEDKGPGAKAIAKGLSRELKKEDVSAWVKGDLVAEAALESFRLADEVIYPQYRKDRGRVGESYRDRMRPLVDERLKRAGVRLAAVLNGALGD